MHWGSARQVWHDAFAVHDRTPNAMVPCGTKCDNGAQIANRVEAGKVIAVVNKLSPELKSFGMYCYAPRHTDKDELRVKQHVYRKYKETHGITSMSNNFDKLIRFMQLLNYAVESVQSTERCSRDKYNYARIAVLFNQNPANWMRDWRKTYDDLHAILDIMPRRALTPVARLVYEEKDKLAI